MRLKARAIPAIALRGTDSGRRPHVVCVPRKNQTKRPMRVTPSRRFQSFLATLVLFAACDLRGRGRGLAGRSGGGEPHRCRRATSASMPEPIRAYLAIQPGRNFTAADEDASLKALFETGLFADVQLDVRGSTLVVIVVENPVINEVAFEGNKKFKDDQLSGVIESAPRGVFTRAKVQSDVAKILELYRRSARFEASVTPETIELPNNRVNLVFVITEGPKTGISGITFIGNRRLRRRAASQRHPDPPQQHPELHPGRRHLRPRPACLRRGEAPAILPRSRLCRFPGHLVGRRSRSRAERVLHCLHRRARARATASGRSPSIPPFPASIRRCCEREVDDRRGRCFLEREGREVAGGNHALPRRATAIRSRRRGRGSTATPTR